MIRRQLRLAAPLVLTVLVGAAAAQEFVFTTNRLRAEPSTGPSGAQLYQNELYIYHEGTEYRLTTTPTDEE